LTLVRESVLSRPETVDKNASLTDAIGLLRGAKADRVIVIDGGRVRGIVTLRDLISKLATPSTRMIALSALHISGFMSEPVVHVSEDEPIQKAAASMMEGSFTSVPVVSGNGELQGLIDRLSLASMIEGIEESEEISVADVMRQFPVTLDPMARLLHARQLLLTYDVSVLPIVRNSMLIGVIGLDEIAEAILGFYERSRGEPIRYTPLKYLRVIDAVRVRVPTVDVDATLRDAARSMRQTGYRAVIVAENGIPKGMITGLELAAAIIS